MNKLEIGDKHTFSNVVYRVYKPYINWDRAKEIGNELNKKGYKTRITSDGKSTYNYIVWVKVNRRN